MGLWTNIGRLAGIGAIQGVQNPGPTDILTPVQAVQVVDDVSYAVPPVIVPVTSFFVDIPSVAAERGQFVLRPGPRGSTLRWGFGTNGASAGIVEDVAVGPGATGTLSAVATATGGVTARSWSQAHPPSSRCTAFGTNPNPSAFTAFGISYIDINVTDFALFIAPDTEVLFQSPALAAAFRLHIIVQDVP